MDKGKKQDSGIPALDGRQIGDSHYYEITAGMLAAWLATVPPDFQVTLYGPGRPGCFARRVEVATHLGGQYVSIG